MVLGFTVFNFEIEKEEGAEDHDEVGEPYAEGTYEESVEDPGE